MTLPRSETRTRRLGAPAAVAAVGAAAAAALYLRDPHRPGAYGFCPFHAATGLWCPACGGLRALNDLTHGDLLASLSSNLFVAPLVVVLAIAWAAWVSRRWRGVDDRMIVLSRTATVAVLVALAVFTIVRNTPWGSALAPI
ncbi:DUF2752 domain-containing protein [Rhodococcus sp. NPDC127528]|uniref:DUF2752 domain-containing protein n=1 Tax=unclassified Rhodococcus (in: high G+C Gram-positive bacteria) TaxID=192944 RepID=UPI00362E78D1